MSKYVLSMILFGGLLGGGLIGGCGDGEGDGSSGAVGAAGAGPQWYPGECTRTDSVCGSSPCKESRTYTYNGEGKLVAYTYDSDADGTTDYKITFTYNADGTRTEHHDTDADGTVDETWTRDANPKSWQEGLDAACRQSPGQRIDIDTGSLVCDTSGRPMKLEYGSGRVTTYTYDSKGRLLRKEHTGPQPSVTTYTYDSKGRLLREEETGSDPWLVTYNYEPDGTGWTSESSLSIDDPVVYRFTCTCGECWNHEY